MTKKPTFRIQEPNPIKPQKHSFFIGEKHFDNQSDRAMTELIQALQRAIVKPVYESTQGVYIIMVTFQGNLHRYILTQESYSNDLLTKKKVVSFVLVYFYRGLLIIIEVVTIVWIGILKVTCFGLEKIARHPLLAYLVFSIILAWFFSKCKEFKNQKNNENNNQHKKKKK